MTDELKKAEEISRNVEGRVIDRCLNDGDTRNADKYWREETTKALRRQSVETLERPEVKALVEVFKASVIWHLSWCQFLAAPLPCDCEMEKRKEALAAFTKLKSDLETKGEVHERK